MPGEHVALIGANGAGKSTLLAVLMRHLSPAQGVVRFDGQDASTVSSRSLRELMAVVDDEPHVFAGSVRSNLLLDEPVAHLDHPTAQRVMADLHMATRRQTVLLVSHQQVGIDGCDRSLQIGNGVTIDNESPVPRDTVMV